VSPFLRPDSPPLQIHRPLSPPLFLRSNTSPDSLWAGISDAKDIVDRLIAVPAPVLEELEDDVDNVSVSIIDGWSTRVVSIASLIVCEGNTDY
jgi:hypothetical protein